ncbi:hypothetical protein R1sor_000205 [Riccia sorocarpa]|uniref:Cytochrome P450 n=1 Tax=Riccia sorocarpa TaxID=122646 RepID=A0ABD3GSN8_9MARC
MGSIELLGVLMQTAAKRLPWHSTDRSSVVPPGPAYDMAFQLAADPLRCLEDLKSQYGAIVGFRLISRPVVLVSSPAQAREVFITKSKTFVKEGTAFFPNSSLAGNGLLVSDGEVWKRQRRLSNPAFRKAAVDSYAQACADRNFNSIREGTILKLAS